MIVTTSPSTPDPGFGGVAIDVPHPDPDATSLDPGMKERAKLTLPWKGVA